MRLPAAFRTCGYQPRSGNTFKDADFVGDKIVSNIPFKVRTVYIKAILMEAIITPNPIVAPSGLDVKMYGRLLAKFAPKIIENEAENEAALAIVEQLHFTAAPPAPGPVRTPR
jgi:hypothetical protein